jgi:hypothetical protein
MTAAYAEFLRAKAQYGADSGFEPNWIPDFLFPFQRDLTAWAIQKGRAAIFADCGLGKTPMQLVWAQNVVERTNKPVLIATPLAVSHQVVREAAKFGIECERIPDGNVGARARIVVTNYERLHLFNANDVAGAVCDESSILKNFDGVRKAEITEFLRTLPYRLLCTATAAPNDYTELGTSAEALGVMGYIDMLGRFFKNDQHTVESRQSRGHVGGPKQQYRFKRHAERPFWRWVCSWARAVRRPSDLGYPDDGFTLPPLVEKEHVVKASQPREGWLFDMPANDMREEREERRRTIAERCAMVADLVTAHDQQALVWCHLNPEGDRLVAGIPDAEQVAGSDSDDEKEAKLSAFANGDLRVLVTKPKIGAWGLNLQNCAHITTFPSHSYEQYYQAIRRCWRFGQMRPVTVDIISTEGEQRILGNLHRKAAQADRMFSALVAHMNESLAVKHTNEPTISPEIPAWL